MTTTLIDGRVTREFRTDEDRAVGMALELATELTYEGQHFAAATIRALLEHLRAARGEEAAAARTPSIHEDQPAEAAGVPAPRPTTGAKRGRPPKKPVAEAPVELPLAPAQAQQVAAAVEVAPVVEVPGAAAPVAVTAA
jgi:hypothetical protein